MSNLPTNNKHVIRELYPTNSHRAKENPEIPEKKIEPLTKGVRKKQNFWKRMFKNDDSDTVWGYVLYDVLLPAAKKTLYEMVNGGLGIVLFKDPYKSGSRFTRVGDTTRIRYEGFSKEPSRSTTRIDRARHSFDTIKIETRGEAQDVLARMVDIVQEYGLVTVADFYALVGITSEYTDRDWGWTSLETAGVERLRYEDGYIINLEKPQWLK